MKYKICFRLKSGVHRGDCTNFNLAANRLFCDLLFSIDVIVVIFDDIIDLALDPGENPLVLDFTFIGGLSDVGVDSVELFIGDKDGT